MKLSKLILVISICLLSTAAAVAQSEHTGWLFLTHKQKVSKKFDLLADVQFRSADKLAYLTTLLLRGALSYNINQKHSVALGYAFKGDWVREDGERVYSPENRIYEQYLYNSKLGRTELDVRLRLEQRFVEDGDINFSQRARAFLSVQIPLLANEDFSKGLYAGVQNEIFLNVQHNEKVNNSVFDQNRTFGSLGYRWSKKIDTEFGYLYWYQQLIDQKMRTNVLQLMVTTKL